VAISGFTEARFVLNTFKHWMDVYSCVLVYFSVLCWDFRHFVQERNHFSCERNVANASAAVDEVPQTHWGFAPRPHQGGRPQFHVAIALSKGCCCC